MRRSRSGNHLPKENGWHHSYKSRRNTKRMERSPSKKKGLSKLALQQSPSNLDLSALSFSQPEKSTLFQGGVVGDDDDDYCHFIDIDDDR